MPGETVLLKRLPVKMKVPPEGPKELVLASSSHAETVASVAA
jgi:hypothetical protein